MSGAILITGAAGVVGTALAAELASRNERVIPLDLLGPDPGVRGDVRYRADVRRPIASCRGVVHLAAVSRVALAENDPAGCWSTNVDGTRQVVSAALAARPRPWLLFTSSREVYGEPGRLPVTEDAPLNPINVYGRSKLAGEVAIGRACHDGGLRAAIVRLSNVYGASHDHPDRVIPAMVRAATAGTPLRIDGPERIFDFTHIDDVTRGLVASIDRLDAGIPTPPVHLASGVPTSLGDLARFCGEMSGAVVPITEAPARAFEVGRFVGDPTRAAALLGWRATVALSDGISKLAHVLQAQRGFAPKEVSPR